MKTPIAAARAPVLCVALFMAPMSCGKPSGFFVVLDADIGVRDTITQLTITAKANHSGAGADTLTPPMMAFPMSFLVTPGNPNGDYVIVAQGRLNTMGAAGTTLMTREILARAIVRGNEDQLLVVPLVFRAACRQTCQAEQTCGPRTCMEARRDGLAVYTAGVDAPCSSGMVRDGATCVTRTAL